MHANKHQTFLQVDAINHGGHGQVYPNYTKEQVCKVLAIFQNFFILGQFWIKLGPKWPIIVPNEVFWTLIKIESLILAGITFKWWIILSFIILCKPYVWENSNMGLFIIIHLMFLQHWTFSCLNMESIPSVFFMGLIFLRNISSLLLFQAMGGPCKLACFIQINDIWLLVMAK